MRGADVGAYDIGTESWEPGSGALAYLADVLPLAQRELLIEVAGRVGHDAPAEAWLAACRSPREHERLTAAFMELEAADMLDQVLLDVAEEGHP